jgi:mono/diheme cytochrome c family protein
MPWFHRRRAIILLVFIILGVVTGLLSLLHRPSSVPSSVVSRAVLIDSGHVAFRTCSLCHGRNGQGERCPPLIYSDFVQGDPARLIRFVLRPTDTVRVNGVMWRNSEMPALETLSDFEVAAVLTYIRSLNDSLVTCTPQDVEAGTWAECRTRERPPTAIRNDSITPDDVASVRALLPGKQL